MSQLPSAAGSIRAATQRRAVSFAEALPASRLATALLLPWLVPLVGCDSSIDLEVFSPPPTPPQDVAVQRLRPNRAERVDLLLMIDNSASMADKQAILADAIPDLVSRLVNPRCVDRVTRQVAMGQPSGPAEPCGEPQTQQREFDPVLDIHVGVISSSLGGFGADSCSEASGDQFNPRQADMAHLLDRAQGGEVVPTYKGMGFLSWDPGGASSPPGEADPSALGQAFRDIVQGVGQVGCGFEASLEAWYRFLVDPAPYEKMVPVPCNEDDTAYGCRGGQGIDQIVLNQRAAFLRQDSVLAIIMLSDENDCSIIDSGQNYLALQARDGDKPFHVSRGTDACKTDPWSSECHSCWVNPGDHPECAAGWGDEQLDDPLNLRCFEQKRRFGMSFLQPIRRYVDGLTQTTLADGTVNPLFCSKFPTVPDPNDPNATLIDRTQCLEVLRDPSLIFLAGIVGVPWQDLARDPESLAQGYRPAEELAWTSAQYALAGQSAPPGLGLGQSLWDLVLGPTDPGTLEIVSTGRPIDPLMVESIDPRSGVHPATGVPLVAPGSSDPVAHPVNGSEVAFPSRSELQYACTFELNAPLDCALPENAFGCDCVDAPDNPLCWDGSAYGSLQMRAKAYPARRQLAVLKGLDAQAVVASICPSTLSDPAAADYGYRPAVGAVVDRIGYAMRPACLEQPLDVDEAGLAACSVIEARHATPGSSCAPCTGSRGEVDASTRAAVAKQPEVLANNATCLCEIAQTQPGEALDACRMQDVVTSTDGWCYVDPVASARVDPLLVAACAQGRERIVRFVGDGVPSPDALVFVVCEGD